MLSNNTFLQTKIQDLLDGLIFVEKGLSVHVQRMLKMSRGYTIGCNFMQNICKKWRKIGELIYDHGLTKLRFGAKLILIKIYYAITACTIYTFYIWKMLTNREMVNFQKWDFFDLSLYSNYKSWHYRSMKNAYWVYVLLYLYRTLHKNHFVAQKVQLVWFCIQENYS